MSSAESIASPGAMDHATQRFVSRAVWCATCAMLLSLVFGCADGWGEARAVLDQLSCGMSKEDVASLLARTTSGAKPTPVPADDLYDVAIDSGPNLRFFFSPEGLYAVRVTEAVGLMRVFEHPRENLCTGERSIRVTVVADEKWRGSSISLNGHFVGDLPDSAVPSTDLELPLGEHQVQLAGRDDLSAAASLDLTEKSSHLTVVFLGPAAPVVTADPETPPSPRLR